MSDIEPEKNLSPPSVQVLAGWLRRQEGISRPSALAPAIPELVHYLCGAVPPREADAVEARLTTAGGALRLMRIVRSELLRLEAMPWEAVAEAGNGTDQRAEIATAWLKLTAAQMQAAERAPAYWLATGWQTLRNQLEAGVGEALATWNSFLAFGAQWSRELHAPGRFALERGGGTSSEALLPGVSAPVQVEADIDRDDTLRVTLRIETPQEAPETTLEGRSVLLALRSGTELWPVSTALLTAGFAEWDIPGFGAATGMPVGEIPLDALQFALLDVANPTHTATPLRLFAEITDRAGHASDRGLVPIIFLEEPRWSGGEFFVRVELPAETRHWLAVGFQLRLDVAVSGSHWQHIGAWTLGDGDDAPHTLQASCPGSLDIILPSVTLIRAQLRPPE